MDSSKGLNSAHIEPARRGRRFAALSSNRWFLLLTIGSFVLITLIAGVTFWVLAQQFSAIGRQRAAVAHSQQVIDYLSEVWMPLQEAHGTMLIYTVNGDAQFLANYHRAQQTLPKVLDGLQQLLQGTRAGGWQRELDRQVRTELDYIEQIVAMYAAAGPDSPALAEMLDRSRQQLEATRTLLFEKRDAESALMRGWIERGVGELQRARNIALGSLLAATLSILLICAWLLRHMHRREQAERQLKLTSALWRQTIDNVAQGLAVYDADIRLIAWNRRYCELRGIDPAQLYVGATPAYLHRLGGIPLSEHTPDSARAQEERLRNVIFHGKTDTREWTRADGAIIEASVRPMEGGMAVLTFTDVTTMRRSEAAARDQATRLSAIVDNAPDAIITFNESGSVESWSRGAERMFGYAAAEVLRRHVNILMPSAAAEGAVHDWARSLGAQEPQTTGKRPELEARRKDGTLFPVDLGVSEMRLADKRLFVCLVRDITERRALERMKTEFISTVSHELRTPLTSIAGSLGLVTGGAAGELPAKAMRLLNIAQKNSQRLTLLINDILDLEKAESGNIELKLRPQWLRPIVEQAIEANRAFAERLEVRIEFMQLGEDALVRVDAERMVQVITNLLSNAAKFSPPQGVVRVILERQEHSLKLAVHDNGPGVPAEFRARIFTRFAQADASDSRRKDGTGLGLAIAKSLTESHGGRIGFASGESAVGKGQGATFWVELPVVEEASIDAETTVVLPRGRAVLICEDDPDVAAVLADLLQQEGLSVDIAHTAAEARRVLHTRAFDALLLDLHLPDEDGMTLLASLRADPATRDLPAVFVSAQAHFKGDRTKLSAMHVVDWLQKPADPVRLRAALRSALRGAGSRPCILHVEDDAAIAAMVRVSLEEEAKVVAAAGLAEARQKLAQESFAALILDLELSDGSGVDLLAEVRRLAPQTPVVLYSVHEASAEITAMVEAALVKSRHSLDKLKDTLDTLISKARGAEREA